MYQFAFITQGHVHDSSIPGWVESENSVNFLSEVLNIDPLDMATKFEQWVCARDWGKSCSFWYDTLGADLWWRFNSYWFTPEHVHRMHLPHCQWPQWVPLHLLISSADLFLPEMTLKVKKIVMNYMNYKTWIVKKYKAELLAWLSHIKFANPSANWHSWWNPSSL
jgi:hypothetical protein